MLSQISPRTWQDCHAIHIEENFHDISHLHRNNRKWQYHCLLFANDDIYDDDIVYVHLSCTLLSFKEVIKSRLLLN